MHKNKLYVQGKLLFLTSRVEKDLPFATCKVLNTAIWGILARANEQWDISVCHFVFMTNHFHMLVVVRNPADVPMFVKHIKQETAAAVNRICGIRQNTVWTRGFDDPIVLSADKALDIIKYIYKNPANAHLVSSIEQYPGVSSWEMFKNKEYNKKCVWLKRSSFSAVPNLTQLSDCSQAQLISEFAGKEPIFHTFKLSPNAWMECFEEYKNADRDTVNQQIIDEILCEEQQIEHPNGVLGANKLRIQPINKKYKPSKYGKRMFCICSDVEIRKKYIGYLKYISQKAKDAYKAIKNGICNIVFPPGTFMPGGAFLEPLAPCAFLAI